MCVTFHCIAWRVMREREREIGGDHNIRSDDRGLCVCVRTVSFVLMISNCSFDH
jgi:signal transduction histidine kinase